MIRDTSLDAYYNIVPELGERQIFALELIKKNPDKTALELKVIAGLVDANNIRPRITELQDMKVIEPSGKRKCEISNRTCYTWRVKER